MSRTAIFLCILIAYALGNTNPAYLFAKGKGYDARVDGSGNAGACNAFILAGKAAFFITAAFGIFKAYAAYRICRGLFPSLPAAEQIKGAAQLSPEQGRRAQAPGPGYLSGSQVFLLPCG